MLRALAEALAAVREDPAVRVVVVAGSGPAFCAGHDLKELRDRDYDPDYVEELFALCARVMTAIVRLPKPVLARVHGVATAAGCQLVASADLAFAALDARFATPGVNIGLFCSTPMVALSRNVAPKHALKMLLVGRADRRRRGPAHGPGERAGARPASWRPAPWPSPGGSPPSRR